MFKSQILTLQCLAEFQGRYHQLVPPLDMASAGLVVWLAGVSMLFLVLLGIYVFDGFMFVGFIV